MTTTTSTAFGDLTIRFDERVLRPRLWTRAQSHWAAELAGTSAAGDALELCTGAGQIGLLFAQMSGWRVVAVDSDPAAGELARANAVAAGLATTFEVRVGPMEQVLDPGERFAIVIADPPWVTRAETDRYPEDPLPAIDGGEDGLDVAQLCLAVAARHLVPGGSLVLQLGTEAQAEALAATLPDRLRHRELRTCSGGVLVHLVAS